MAVQPGLCGTWSETPKTDFLTTRLILKIVVILKLFSSHFRVTGGELFEDIVAREFYSEADARYVSHLL